MKYGIYAIFDAVSGVFTAPTIDLADSAAARNFRKMCADAGSMVNFAPADFAIYRIGDFDVETGAITPLSPVMCVLRGSDVKGDGNV